MRRYTTYVPDEIWFDKSVDHFEYGAETSVAVFSDGRRVEFDSRVTDERLEEQRKKDHDRMMASGQVLFSARFEVKVDRRDFHNVVVGITE
jgi:hypothetical protein